MANIFDLSAEEFRAVLPELASQGVDTDALVREYRRKNSALAPVYGLIDRVRGGDAEAGRERANILPMTRPTGTTGLEALLGGEAELAVPGALLEAAEGAAMGVDAPAAASRGLIPMADAPMEALGTAGSAMLGGGAAAGRGVLDYDPEVVRAFPSSLSAEERIAASTPKSWLDPKFERPQWHPISSTSMRTPAEEVQPRFEQLGLLSPEREITIEEMQGRVITPAYGDRTVAGVNITGYDDVEFASPVRAQGGRDFMREEGTGLWASERDPMTRKSNAINRLLDEGEDPGLVYAAMGAQSGDFSKIMMQSVLNQFDPDKITDEAARKFDDRMKALNISSWPGTKSGRVAEALDSMPGSTRWAIWQEMDKAGYRDAGFPDIGLSRVAITDPALLNVDPFTSGLNVGRPTGLLTNTDFEPHPSYSYQIGGEYEGGLGNLPGQIIWRDFFEQRRASGSSPASDQRAFMMKSPEMTQRVDQQMVDEVNAWLESQRQSQ